MANGNTTPADRLRAYAADFADNPDTAHVPLERQWFMGRDGTELAMVSDLFNVLADHEELRNEISRLWYFFDHQPQLLDIVTERPEHYVVNGDHSGCGCGTDWTPPPVRLEWAISHVHAIGGDDCRHGAADEAEARRMAGDGTYFTVVRRLVSEWRPADGEQSS